MQEHAQLADRDAEAEARAPAPASELVQSPLTLEQIERLEGASLQLPPEMHRPVGLTHEFPPGYYVRTITVPADTFLIGHYQKTGFMNFMLKGKVSAVINGKMMHLTGPCVLYSDPGQRKIGYVHEEMVWTTVHPNPTNETDVARIEDILLIKSDTFLAHETARALGRVKDALTGDQPKEDA